jgi:hypothetical protein
MFYEGDLQSGISQALQESKLVACFVTGKISMAYSYRCPSELIRCLLDEEEESQLWENDFLAEPAVRPSESDRR